MPIIIRDIRLSLEEDLSELTEKARTKLKLSKGELQSVRIIRESIDARKKTSPIFNYILAIEAPGQGELFVQHLKDTKVEWQEPEQNQVLLRGSSMLKNRPVIVGTGPAGLFAGWLLATYGYRPILVERGKSIKERAADVEKFWKTAHLQEDSNVQFGEGGAGTFSDGKLTTRIKDTRCDTVLKILTECGAPEDICYAGKAHIGTDLLRSVLYRMRQHIISLGGTFHFQTRIDELVIENQCIQGVRTCLNDFIAADVVIMAIGHSARDTYQMLWENGVKLTPKPFAIGARIEHVQQLINESQYGAFAQHPRLGAADYQLTGQGVTTDRSIYTFCMCPGGVVIAGSSEPGRVVTNGMSMRARNGENANSALVVSIRPEDFPIPGPLGGIAFQRMWESKAFALGGNSYHAPVQRVGDFLQRKPTLQFGSVSPSYLPGVVPSNLWDCLPVYIAQTMKEAIIDFDRKIRGFAMPDALLTGVETRTSAPVRIERNEQLEAEGIQGLYPTGEGAGYAGGIISAAVDGIKVGEKIIQRYKPFE